MAGNVAGLLVLLLVAGAAAPPAIPAQGGSSDFLEGYHGPYRGRVVDAETQQPIAGAVVVATWRRFRTFPFRSVHVFHTARETVTDAEGRFVLEPRDVEEHAPPDTRHPEFLIFAPGYGAFPWDAVSPTGYIGRAFEGGGATVELPPRRTREERRRRSSLGDLGLVQVPRALLPQLLDRLNVERAHLGLSPYPRSEE